MAELILFGTSIGAGFLGSLLGLGGGIIVVPVLTLAMGVHIRYAIAASLISIVATSSGAAAGFLRDRLTNLRVAVLLEVGTVTGAVAGYLISSKIKSSVLYLLFGSFLLFSAAMMLRKREAIGAGRNHPWSSALGLSGAYTERDGRVVEYPVDRVPFALATMFGAGVMSALLGIGSGILKVLAMDGAMRLPMKVSSATSNFMIGVTAAASAGALLARGDVRPEIVAPVAVGVLLGSLVGVRVMTRMPAALIRKIFVVVLVVTAFQMMRAGLQ